MSMGGMLQQFAAQTAQPAQLSQSQRGLLNTAGRSFGKLSGGYTEPDLSTSAGALAAARQAQDFGHMQDYAQFMDTAKGLQGQEAQSARVTETNKSREAMAADKIESDEKVNTARLAMDKYGIDLTTGSRKELSLMDNAFAYERLQLQIASSEGMQKKKLEAEAAIAKDRLENMWKIASADERGRMSRAYVTAASKDKEHPTLGDIDALTLAAENHPDPKVREALEGESVFLGIGKDSTKPTAAAVATWDLIGSGYNVDDALAGYAAGGDVWSSVQDGVAYKDAQALVAAGHKYVNGKWQVQ